MHALLERCQSFLTRQPGACKCVNTRPCLLQAGYLLLTVERHCYADCYTLPSFVMPLLVRCASMQYQTAAVHVPVRVRELGAKLYRVKQQLQQQLHGREPTVEELAAAAGVSVQHAQRALAATSGALQVGCGRRLTTDTAARAHEDWHDVACGVGRMCPPCEVSVQVMLSAAAAGQVAASQCEPGQGGAGQGRCWCGPAAGACVCALHRLWRSRQCFIWCRVALLSLGSCTA